MSPRQTVAPMLPSEEAREGLVPQRLWALLAIVPVLSLFLASDFRPALHDSAYPDHRVRAGGAALADRLGEDDDDFSEVLLSGAWITHEGGLGLSGADDAASVVVRIPPADWDAAEVRVDGARQVEWGIRISWVEGYGSNRSLVSNTPVLSFRRGDVIRVEAEDVPGLLVSTEPITITLTPRPPEGVESLRDPVLSSVDVRATSDARNPLPSMPDYLGMALVPFLAGLVLRLAFGFSVQRCFAGGLGFGILGYLMISGQATQGDEGIAWAIALGVAIAALGNAALGMWGVRRHPRLKAGATTQEWHNIGATIALLMVLLVAVNTGWKAFEAERRSDLGPAGVAMIEAAQGLDPLLAPVGGDPPRAMPPMQAWVLAVWYGVAPPSESSARFLGLLFFLLATVLAFEAGRRVFHLPGGLIGGLLFAQVNFRVMEAVQVGMLDVLLALFFGLLLAHLAWKDRRRVRAAAWGVLGSAIALAAPWSVMLLAVGLILTYRVSCCGEHPWRAGESALVVVAFLLAGWIPLLISDQPGGAVLYGIGEGLYSLFLWLGFMGLGFVGTRVVMATASWARGKTTTTGQTEP